MCPLSKKNFCNVKYQSLGNYLYQILLEVLKDYPQC